MCDTDNCQAKVKLNSSQAIAACRKFRSAMPTGMECNLRPLLHIRRYRAYYGPNAFADDGPAYTR